MEVKFKEFKKDKLLGLVSVKLGDLWVTGFKLMIGQYGEYIVPPQMKDKKGEYRPIVFLTKEKGKEILEEVQKIKKEKTLNPIPTNNFEDDEFPF